MFHLFIALVLALNLYDWWRLRCAFLKHNQPLAVGLLLVILMLVLTPAFVRLAKSLPPGLQEWFAQLSWIWLAFAFMLGFAFLVMDLWNIGVYAVAFLPLGEHWLPQCLRFLISPFGQGCAAIAYLGFAATWGILEAQSVRLKEVVVESPLVPPTVGEYRVALMTDMHLGPSANWSRLRRVMQLFDDAKPDLILDGGDLVEVGGHGSREQKMAQKLAELHCTSGKKFAVLGNHDVYAGVENSRTIHELAGLQLLEENTAVIDGWLYLHGVRDPAFGGRKMPGDEHHRPTFPPIPANHFSILLEHRPDLFPEMPAYSLILSGHTHNGQIFPFNYLVKLQYPRPIGKLLTLERGIQFYNSLGTGVWGPPFRLLAPPEVTLFLLRHKEP